VEVRRWRSRILVFAGSILAALTLAEGALWGLHFLLSPARRAEELAPRPGERRILCIGDSYTFGVYVDASASYPGRLQTYLDLAGDQPWRVVNLGYPGQNTAQIRGRLAENLAAYRPEIVCFWAGINDRWSPAMRHLWDQPDSESAAATLESFVQHIRLYRLARMLATRDERSALPARKLEPHPGQGVVPGLDGVQRGEGLGEIESLAPTGSQFSDDEVRRHIEVDLARILAICRAHGAKLVIADYPLDVAPFRSINPVLDRFAEENAVPLVLLHERIPPVAAEVGPKRILFTDRHVTALGNFEVARCFLETLIASGMVESRPEWTGLPPVSRIAEEPHVAVAGRAGSKVRIEVLFEPSWKCALALEGPVKLSTSAELDETGSVVMEVELPPDRLDAAWHVQAVLTAPDGVQAEPRSSRVIDLPPVHLPAGR